MEVEAKFRVDNADVFRALLAASSIGPYTLTVDAIPEVQENTYFDTETGIIRRSKHALRVRTIGNKRIASWKGSTHTIGAVQERAEWEVEIGDEIALETWPESEARTRAMAMVGNARLRPIVSVQTVRRNIQVDLGGTSLAVISLDEGTIAAGGRTLLFRELEIELMSDRRSEFDALVLRFAQDERLMPEPKSKFQRGLELRDIAVREDI